MKFNTKIAVDGTAGIISKLKICLRGEAPKRCDSGKQLTYLCSTDVYLLTDIQVFTSCVPLQEI